jgi:CRP-like cAMP-binding protein
LIQEIIGEMGVITGMPRSATVEAEDNVRLFVKQSGF